MPREELPRITELECWLICVVTRPSYLVFAQCSQVRKVRLPVGLTALMIYTTYGYGLFLAIKVIQNLCSF